MNELPTPRLQLRWEHRGNSEWLCHYELVMPLGEYDIRRESYDEYDNMIKGPLYYVAKLKEPSIRRSEREPCSYGEYDAPFRDGAHALWDATALGGIPIYCISPSGQAYKRPNNEDKK